MGAKGLQGIVQGTDLVINRKHETGAVMAGGSTTTPAQYKKTRRIPTMILNPGLENS